MLWIVERIVVDLSVSLTEQLYALRLFSCYYVSCSLPVIAHCAILHVLDEKTDGALREPARGWKCNEIFKCTYCATDLRVYVVANGRNVLSLRVETWQDFGTGPNHESAGDELFHRYPPRLHRDDIQRRNLEQLFMTAVQLAAIDVGRPGDESKKFLVAQDYDQPDWKWYLPLISYQTPRRVRPR